MQWEFSWIDQNTHFYNGVEHIALVKANIAKRYRRNAILMRWRELRKHNEERLRRYRGIA
jgi:tRNA A-37 threonylcarbamoyl transferase component Bud32